MTPRKFETLQACRGVAALLVVMHHTSTQYFNSPRFWPTPAFGRAFDFGHAGVFFFFVLSGFIILSAHRHDIGHPDRLARYAVKRFLRIYPTYWIVLIPLAVVYLLWPQASRPTVAAHDVIANSFLLIGRTNASSLIVAWTLFHEMLFYLAFGVLIWRRRIGLAIMALWFALCAIIACTDVGITYHFSYLNLLFLVGIACFLLSARVTVSRPLAVAILGAVAFIVIGMVEVYRPGLDPRLQAIGYGLTSGVLILGLVALEQTRRPLRLPPFLLLLGDASYAIYLIHFPVLSIATRLWIQTIGTQRIAINVSFAAMVLIAVFTGIGFHLAIERRVLAIARIRTRSSDQTSLA